MDAPSSRRPRRFARARSLLALFVISSLSLGMFTAAGPSAAQVVPPDNPAGDYSMWREDELFVPLASAGQVTSTGYEYNPADNTLSAPLAYCQAAAVSQLSAAQGPQMGAAAGRVTNPFYDQVMVASPTAAYSLNVSFADGCDLVTNEAARPAVTLGPATGMPSLMVNSGLPFFYDITTGDLDRHSRDGMTERDEVIVVYAGAGTTTTSAGAPIVAVVDYTTTDTTPSAPPAITWQASPYIVSSTLVLTYDIAPIPLAVTTGDFDGDTHKEIAVAYLISGLGIRVNLYRYTTTETDGTLTHSLTQVSTLTSTVDQPSGVKWDASRWVGSLDAASGDLNGDGKDELSVAASAQGEETEGAIHSDQVAVNLKTFQSDATLTLTQANPNTSGTIAYRDNGKFGARVELASGLFKYAPSPEPSTDYGINRRQLALAMNGSSGAVALKTIDFDADLVATTAGTQRIPPSGDPSERLKFWLAAGSFKGLQSAESEADVVWSLAFMKWDKNGQVLYLFDPDPATGELDTAYFTTTVSTAAYPHSSGSTSAAAPLVAYDHGRPTAIPDDKIALRGDAVYLSQPLHIILEGFLNTDYILQEPPKHVYWDPTGGPDGRGAVVNVSGQDTFKIGRKETTTIGVTKSSHDTYDHSWGVSETASASVNYGGGLWVPPKFEASLKETVAYDYQSHHDDYNKTMDQREVSLTLFGVRDDAINYRVQTIDLWRYYVFGAKFEDEDNSPLLGFFDITVPRPGAQTNLVAGAGHTDWYQPVHENNNILSYPSPTLLPTGERGLAPTDMGSFQVPCTDLSGKTCDKDPDTNDPLTTMTVTGPLVDRVMWEWGGISGEQELKDTRTATTGTERTSSKTVSTNEDLKITGRGRIPYTAQWKFELSLDVAFHGKWSWGDAHATEATTTELSSLWFNVPPGNSSMGYKFYPLFYVTDDGTTKVAFAVDMTGTSGEANWNDIYGQQPDPALNLPLRFNAGTDATGTVWTPNIGVNRKLMRGFFIQHAEADKDGDYIEYSGPPSAGETVRLETRVYNYSTLKGVGLDYGTAPLTVRFEYVEVNGTQEVGARTPIGTTTVSSIAPRGMETAAVNWTIPTFTDGSLSKNYRVYVVLDPDNTIPNEKYETESVASRTYCKANCANTANYIDPGQNNEGFRQLTVTSFPPTNPRFSTPGDVHLKSDALAAITPQGKLKTKNVQAYLGLPLQIRVQIDTDQPGADYQHLLLYDGDPNAGGTLITDVAAYTGNPDGNEVWIEWIPTDLGPHRLYAKILEGPMDPGLDNATSGVLKVEVIKPPQGPKPKK